MLKASCHCGAVSIAIPRIPESLTDCNCSLCRRYATLWAYFKQSEVEVTAAPDAMTAYSRGAKTIEFLRCARCGCVTHWAPIVPERGERMGVNARLFEPRQFGSVRIRHLDGAVTEAYID
jgi:hypothetical protein